MFYVKNLENQIVLVDEDKQKIINTLEFQPQYKDLPILETAENEVIIDFQLMTIEEAEQKADEEEKERIKKLSMTRSDFFNGLILAFGVDDKDLAQPLEALLNNLLTDKVQIKAGMNFFNNALNFYREHTLFDIVDNVPIVIDETTTIQVTAKQWDKFFDETDKRNPEAYKYLTNCTLTITAEPTEAIITINDVEQSTITVNYGDTVKYNVSAVGYIPQEETFDLVNNLEKNVILEKEESTDTKK